MKNSAHKINRTASTGKDNAGGKIDSSPPTINEMFSLRPTIIWRQLKMEPMYFWFLCGYLFIEYVRPQSVWPTIDILPYAQIFILLTIAGLFSEKNIYRCSTSANKLMIAFALVILASMANAYFPADFTKFVDRFLIWLIIYFLIIYVVNTEKRFFIFLLLFVLCNLKMSQHGFLTWVKNGFGFSSWGVTCSPGFFQNSGECGAEMAVFLPIAFYACVILKDYYSGWRYYLFWFLPLSAFGTAIATSSRGALLACGCVMVWATLKSKYRVKAFIGLAILALLVISIMPPEFMARFEKAGDDDTSQYRLEYWKVGLDMMSNHPLLGIGFSQWTRYYGTFYELLKYGAQLPHNIFIEVGAETGYLGLSVFVMLILSSFFINARTRKICTINDKFLFYMAHAFDGALIGYLVAGFFVTITYYPFFWINLAFTVALHTATQRKYLGADKQRNLNRMPQKNNRKVVSNKL